MSSTAEVFRIGTPVFIAGDEDFKGTVTAICIRGTGITYEVVWWDGRTRKSEWLSEFEMTSKVKKMKIGFRTDADEQIAALMKMSREMAAGTKP